MGIRGRRDGDRAVIRPLLVEQALLFDRQCDRKPFPNEARGQVVDRAEVGVDLLPETVEQLDDQSALNPEFLRELIDPYTRHASNTVNE